MTIKTIKYNGVNIHVLKTDDRFRRCVCRIHLTDKYNHEQTFIYQNLFGLLSLNNKLYPKKYLVEREKAERYDLNLKFIVNSNASITTLMIEGRFPNPKYTEKDELRKSLEFIFSFLNQPSIKDGSFDKLSFETATNMHEVSLKSVNQKKENLAEENSEKIISKHTPRAFTIEEKLKYLPKITKENLVDAYNELLTKHLEIFVIGNVDPDEVIDIIKPNIPNIKRKSRPKEETVLPRTFNIVKEVVDDSDTYQTQILFSYNILRPTKREIDYVNPLLMDIIYRKMFDTLREKYSLLYYISYKYYQNENRLKISTSIDQKNIELTKKLINQEINNLKAGKLSNKIVASMKKEYKRDYYLKKESIMSILNNYINQIEYSSPDIEKIYLEIMSVTKEEIIKLANKLRLNLIYVLKEEEKNE